MKLKPAFVTVPISFVIIGLSFLMIHSVNSKREKQVAMNPVRHPVDQKMLSAAKVVEKKVAPDFTGVDGYGENVNFNTYRAGKPAVVVFILHNCPCSLEAQDMFNQLHVSYQRWVRFIGVAEGSAKDVAQFVKEAEATFPVVADEKADVMQKYDAKSSVYTAMIGADGKIIKMFPGYSRAMGLELAEWCSTFSSEPVQKLNLSAVPDKMTTGCTFSRN